MEKTNNTINTGNEGTVNEKTVPVKAFFNNLPKKKIILIGVVCFLVVALIVTGVLLSNILAGKQPELIKATYTGATTAGTILDNSNPGIEVTARQKNGQWITLSKDKWSISVPKVLEPDKTTTIKITSGNINCELQVLCTDSNVVRIDAYYDGELSAGTNIINITDGFSVMATHKNGTKTDITDRCTIVDAPVILEADKTSIVNVIYEDPLNGVSFESSTSIKCSTKTVRRISVNYIGNADEGEILDNNNSGIVVTATYSDGEVAVVDGWKIDQPAVLVSSQTAKTTVSFEGQTAELHVACSVFDPDIYCENCKKVQYNDLARTPDAYIGQLIWIEGKIYDIEADATTSSGYVYRISVGSGKYIRVAYNGSYEDGLFIEDDYVRCYGEYLGLDTDSYTEMPLINSRVIKRRY